MTRFSSLLKRSLLATLLAISLPLLAYARSDYQVEFAPQIIEEAQMLPLEGVLKQKRNGFVYVDLPDAFIQQLFPLLEEHIYETRPGNSYYVQPARTSVGAHISVIYENEIVRSAIWDIAELGETFSFEITEVRSVKMMGRRPRVLFLIAVYAPELEALRERYGLRPLLKGHDFHITIGYQKPGYARGLEREAA